MKKKLLISLFCILSFYLSNGQSVKKMPDQLSELNGLWVMKVKGGTLYESWQKTDETTMTGSGFKVTENNDTLITENILLTVRGNNILYIPTVVDQNADKPVEFTLVKEKKNIFVFENKSHDFPQQIIYQFESTDKLQVVIEGKTNEGFKSIPFSFTRKVN